LKPPLISRVAARAATMFQKIADSYDGAEPSKIRQTKPIETRPDHHLLPRGRRTALNSSLVDAARNHSLTRWAIRQDQNWIADCRFEACTGNPAVDAQLTAIADSLLKPENFDLAARHGIHSFARLIQAHRTLHGDVLILKCRDLPGGRVKIISYDRIDHPNPPSKQWVQGLELEPYTDRTLRYAIRERDIQNGRAGKLWRAVDAKDAILHKYIELDGEAIRGVSPLAPVINTILDIKETMTYGHAKAKLGQILGLVVKRKSPDALRGRQFDSETGEEIQQFNSSDQWEWDLDKSVFQLDLDVDETAEMVESKTPSSETMELISTACREALKALDLPYCWWDGKKQNFYGSIGEKNLYEKACKHKRKSHQETMKEVYRFFFQMAILERRLILPPGWMLEDLKFRLIPDGTPWFEPGKEADASAKAIALGLSSPQLECEKINTDFYQNVAQIKAANDALRAAGLPTIHEIIAGQKQEQDDKPTDEEDDNGDDEASNLVPA